MHQYLGEWQRKQGVEKSHLIILTDGESQCIGRTTGPEESPYFQHVYPRTLGYNTIIRNKGRYYNGIHNANTSATSGLIRILRDSYLSAASLDSESVNLGHLLTTFVFLTHGITLMSTTKCSRETSRLL